MSLEMQALADALEQWGQPTVTGHAHNRDTHILVTGEVRGYSLYVHEPVVYAESLVHA